jgi:hypothetical protein
MPKQLYVPPIAEHLKEDTYCALHHPHVEKYDVQPLIKTKIVSYSKKLHLKCHMEKNVAVSGAYKNKKQ